LLVDIEKIRVEDRIRKDLGDISELAKDIEQNGLINPPTVTPDLVLIAGERRLAACKLLGWQQIEVKVMEVRDYEHQLRLEISENENRKDFTLAERLDWARRLEQVERLKARERQGERTDLNIRENFRGSETGRATDKVAQAVGLGSGRQYEKAKYIADHDPDAIERIDRGESSIHREYERLKAEHENLKQRHAQIQKALEEELQKPPKVEYLERIPEDFALKLIATEERAKELEAKVDRLTKERNLLEKKAKLNEEEAAKYNQLQGQLKQLALEKEHLYRQIESATELSGLVVEIKHLLDKLAPVRYSRALERLDSEVAIRNITELVEMVESWCREMRQYLPSGNYVNAEVVIHEQ